MKKVLVAIALSLPVMAFAAPPGVDGPGGGPGGRDPQQHLERMAKQLDLSEDQKARIEQIFARHRDQMEQLREETQDDINRTLTPEQQAKLAEIEGRREERMEKFKEKWQEQKDKMAKDNEGKSEHHKGEYGKGEKRAERMKEKSTTE